MKYLSPYKLFEIESFPSGSLSEEVYNLFIDYAEKYDIDFSDGNSFGFDEDKSEFTIAEDDKHVVLDIMFKRGFGMDKIGGRNEFVLNDEIRNDILEFRSKVLEFTGCSETQVSNKWNDREYTGLRLYQILIIK